MRITPDKAFFDGLTYVRENEDRMTTYVRISDGKGAEREEVLRYSRCASRAATE